MAKKQFTSSFQDIFSPTTETKAAPAVEKVAVREQESATEEIQRTTILLGKNTYFTIKAIAFWERKQIKDVIQQGLDGIIQGYTQEQLTQMKREFEANGGS